MDFQGFIANGYKDEKGRIKREVTRLVAGYFLRNKSIHILTQVGKIDLLGEQSARVVLFAGITGKPASRSINSCPIVRTCTASNWSWRSTTASGGLFRRSGGVRKRNISYKNICGRAASARNPRPIHLLEMD